MSSQMPEPEVRIVKEANGVRVHAFIAPEMLLSTATYVIEGPNELILVDGQFVVPLAQAFRQYVNGLGKPINRIYLSHEHPDHFFGISAAFSDVPIYALPETIAFLKEHGEEIRTNRAQLYGPWVPEKVVLPTHEVVPGTEVIDGITLELIKLKNAEVETQLAIGLPQLGIYIAQDLIYSGAHVYIHKGMVAGWSATLAQLKQSDYEIFLPGHGTPADKDEIQANIDYMRAAEKLAAESPNVEAYKATLLERYPNRTGPAIIDIYAPALFA